MGPWNGTWPLDPALPPDQSVLYCSPGSETPTQVATGGYAIGVGKLCLVIITDSLFWLRF